MHRIRLAWLAAIAAAAAFAFARTARCAAPDDAVAALREGALVIDVRTAGEYAAQSIPGVTNVPMDRIEKEIAALAPDRNRPILLHCASGIRSASACAALKRMGYTRVQNLGSLSSAREILTSAHPR